MTTLQDVLDIQKGSNYLQAPTANANAEFDAAIKLSGDGDATTTTPCTLSIALVNNTSSSSVYAYVTGLAIDKNSSVCLIESDGKTVYYPDSPASDGTALSSNCSIALGAPGTTTTVQIPQIAGGRVWFCVDAQLTFLLNPGPGLVEPSVTNTSDPNYAYKWDFCEFTFNTTELFANITYVDFVSVPIALNLLSTSGATQIVQGMSATGLATVCEGLTSQSETDGAGWSDLIVKDSSGDYLRALSPNSGIIMNSSLFSGYYTHYVNQVWSKYSSTALTVDTQAQWGSVTGTVSNGNLIFPDVGSFTQPSAADIFSCSTGPFAAYATNTDEMGNLTARLAAAFNRSTLLTNANQPDGEVVSTYYTDATTNHYARIVHSANIDKLGYAFPYDDVAPTQSSNIAGTVADGSPQLWTITIGGPSATTRRLVKLRDAARAGGRSSQQVSSMRHSSYSASRFGRRGVDVDQDLEEEEEVQKWPTAGDEKSVINQAVTAPARTDSGIDLEKGIPAVDKPRVDLRLLLPTAVRPLLEKMAASPAYAYAKPAAEALVRVVTRLLSMSAHTVMTRVVVVLSLLLGSFLMGFFGGGGQETGIEGVAGVV